MANDISIPADAIVTRDNQIHTTSLKVAEAFGKRHANVVRSLQALDCSKEFSQLNFELAEFIDKQGKKRTAYKMTKDGFIFLVMGFSGKKAAQVKEAYIHAFNAMAEKLYSPTPERLTPEQKGHIQALVSQVHQQTGAHWRTIYSDLNAHIGVSSYSEIPFRDYPKACRRLNGEPLPALLDSGYPESIEGDYQPDPGQYHYPLETAKPRIMPLAQQAWLTHDALLDPSYNRPVEKLLNELSDNGHDISGAVQEYKALYLLARSGSQMLHQMRDMAEHGFMRGLNVWFGARH